MIEKKHISKKNKADFHNLIYFLIFSDITASVILSEKKTKNTQLQIDTESILTLKNTKNASKTATIKLSPDKKHRMIFDMKLDSQKLRQDVANLSAQNIKLLRKKTPSEFKLIPSGPEISFQFNLGFMFMSKLSREKDNKSPRFK